MLEYLFHNLPPLWNVDYSKKVAASWSNLNKIITYPQRFTIHLKTTFYVRYAHIEANRLSDIYIYQSKVIDIIIINIFSVYNLKLEYSNPS